MKKTARILLSIALIAVFCFPATAPVVDSPQASAAQESAREAGPAGIQEGLGESSSEDAASAEADVPDAADTTGESDGVAADGELQKETLAASQKSAKAARSAAAKPQSNDPVGGGVFRCHAERQMD